MISTSYSTIRKRVFSTTELVHQLKRRNEEAFSQLYDQYAGALLYSINRMTRDTDSAENVLQLVFEKIVLTIHDYSPTKASLFNWMSLIARNEALHFIREQQGIPPGQSIPGEPEPISFENAGQPALTPHLQHVIAELYMRGFSPSEIEKVLCLQPCMARKK